MIRFPFLPAMDRAGVQELIAEDYAGRHGLDVRLTSRDHRFPLGAKIPGEKD